jgi:glutamyl/glutaminyl-tRNA synthetase
MQARNPLTFHETIFIFSSLPRFLLHFKAAHFGLSIDLIQQKSYASKKRSDFMIRTRYAPSPTGFMHIGNLRTALFEYLIAKGEDDGVFILRIEDTDQERYVEGAADAIFETLGTVGLEFDEGPGVGGAFGPYIQSERKADYLPHAKRDRKSVV